uniref:Protein kinase domain-containing protein n=1 Tax=Ananas comosus var. bracteatus TaxID=296719 RepID=A0A6V7PU75_ANACO|nr:unnamed protein product [Ananas comosus var. bracteatus]
MGGRWNLLGFQLHKVLCVVLMIHFLGDECLSVNLEGLALLKFRSRVEADPHGVMASWGPKDTNPCNWNGVHCIDGKVVMLNLREHSLGGTLAPELGKLSNLRALILSKNNFSGVVPKEIGRLAILEILDLRNNKLSGAIPMEIREMQSLKHLLLCNNSFGHDTPCVETPNIYTDLKSHLDFSCDADTDGVSSNQKLVDCIWHSGLQKLKAVDIIALLLKEKFVQAVESLSSFRSGLSSEHEKKHGDNLSAGFRDPYIIPNAFAHISRRSLLQETSNLPAVSQSSVRPKVVPVPSTGSGLLPAIQHPNDHSNGKKPSPAPAPSEPNAPSGSGTPTNSVVNGPESSKGTTKWVYVLVLPVAALLLTTAVCMLLVCRSKAMVGTIGPWRTGISGQLQKAFVTGVPKLNRTELENACEDFSNIIATYPEYTVFKGTLSSGVEIAVASTAIASSGDWSKRSETHFRKKIDTLSRINHKTLSIFLYAPNGTLHEHLHVEDFDHIDWSGRMRIIMGTAYCLQHMHELNPPIAHPDLQSSAILLSEDCAAKVMDVSVWKEVIAKGKISGDDNIDVSETPTADPAGNVYNFGILLLEIISGKLPYSEEGSLVNMALECMNESRSIGSLIDPTLKSHKANELDVICEVIQDCIHQDPKKRPKMKEVSAKLREVIAISPEAATPRLSPLWWAELEILSVEAS